MRTLHLKSILVRNFKSFAEGEINFPSEPGLRFIGGDNQLEPSLGANGAGKSALWDIIIWGLYGTSARGHRTSDVLRWGANSCEVWIEFEGLPVIMRRAPPNKIYLSEDKFSIDEQKAVSQEEIDLLIGLTKDQFLQSVVYGQKVKQFLDLSIPERGDLLDNVLKLSLWLRCSERATDKTKDLEFEANTVRSQIAYQDGQLERLSDESDLQQRKDCWTDKHKEEVEQAINEVSRCEASLKTVIVELKEAQEAHSKLGDIKALKDDIENLKVGISKRQVEAKETQIKLRILRDEEKFYAAATQCPECKQKIDPAFAKQRMKEIKERIGLMIGQDEKLNKGTLTLREKLLVLENDYTEKSKRERDVYNRVIRLEGDKRSAERQVTIFEKAAEQKIAEKNPFVEAIAKLREQREAAKKERGKFTRELFKVEGKAAQLDYWKTGFKQVRLFLVKRILTNLEIEVNSAASTLGLPDWHISFPTETENKSGTSKTGIQVDVKSPHVGGKWSAPSPGEEQRVRLAVSLGLSSLIQRMNGVWFNFEVHDEPTAGLSVEGVADLLETLKYRARTTGKSVYLIDHRSMDSSAFDETWIVRKTEAGSEVIKA